MVLLKYCLLLEFKSVLYLVTATMIMDSIGWLNCLIHPFLFISDKSSNYDFCSFYEFPTPKSARQAPALTTCGSFDFYSEEAGWCCSDGNAALEECRGWGNRGEREEKIQRVQEREICSAGKTDKAGCSDRQSRY